MFEVIMKSVFKSVVLTTVTILNILPIILVQGGNKCNSEYQSPEQFTKCNFDELFGLINLGKCHPGYDKANEILFLRNGDKCVEEGVTELDWFVACFFKATGILEEKKPKDLKFSKTSQHKQNDKIGKETKDIKDMSGKGTGKGNSKKKGRGFFNESEPNDVSDNFVSRKKRGLKTTVEYEEEQDINNLLQNEYKLGYSDNKLNVFRKNFDIQQHEIFDEANLRFENGLIVYDEGKDSALVQNESNIARTYKAAIKKRSPPNQNKKVPIQANKSPIQKKITPIQTKKPPTQIKKVPIQKKMTPIRTKKFPIQKKMTSIPIKKASTQVKKASPQIKKAPIPKKTAPIQTKKAPIQKKMTPIQTKKASTTATITKAAAKPIQQQWVSGNGARQKGQPPFPIPIKTNSNLIDNVKTANKPTLINKTNITTPNASQFVVQGNANIQNDKNIEGKGASPIQNSQTFKDKDRVMTQQGRGFFETVYIDSPVQEGRGFVVEDPNLLQEGRRFYVDRDKGGKEGNGDPKPVKGRLEENGTSRKMGQGDRMDDKHSANQGPNNFKKPKHVDEDGDSKSDSESVENTAETSIPDRAPRSKLNRERLNFWLKTLFSGSEGVKSTRLIKIGFIKCHRQYYLSLLSKDLISGKYKTIHEFLNCFVEVLMCD